MRPAIIPAFALILAATACVAPPDAPVAVQEEPPSASSGDGAPAVAAAGPNTYQATVTGDGVQFTMSLFTDLNLPTEQQLTLGPTTVPTGATLTYSVTGFAFIGDNGVSQSGVTRMAGGPPLVITLSRAGVPVEVMTLTVNGANAHFANW